MNNDGILISYFPSLQRETPLRLDDAVGRRHLAGIGKLACISDTKNDSGFFVYRNQMSLAEAGPLQ
jgi:hypothetical protein